MEVKYDIPQYMASVKMSKKNRVLVEGKDDKSHVKNLLTTVLGKNKIKVDTAELIKGNCVATIKNNRAKLEKIHRHCLGSKDYDNLYFLCDREFLKFEINDAVIDLMNGHESEGNLSWTLGHSFENYFIEENIISEAYRYLTNSEFKADAVELFNGVLSDSLRIISAISLAAKDIGESGYPGGVIHWTDFDMADKKIVFNIEQWRTNDNTDIRQRFSSCYRKYLPVVQSSEDIICARICRGHTAMKMLQRIFASCIYQAGFESGSNMAERHANDFAKIKESYISSALCEAWLNSIKGGNKNYPVNLVSSVA